MNTTRGGLNLGGAQIGLGEAKAEEIHHEWTLSPAVDEYLEKHVGMPPMKEPQYPCPELKVDDLTTTDSNDYTKNFTHLTNWFGYLSEVKAKHDAKVLELKEEMTQIETRIRAGMRQNSTRTTGKGEKKPPPTQEMDDKINEDSRYKDVKRQLVFHSEVLLHLNARVTNLDRQLRLMSRQVEIRRQEFDGTGRGSSIGGRGGLPGPGMRTPRTNGYGG